jgi:hypothetical protein
MNADQTLLFPVSPREFAKRTGIPWSALLVLGENKLLSFDPEETDLIELEGQEREARFLGHLVATLENVSLVAKIVRKLSPPYSYSHDELYFDWVAKEWKEIPEPPEPPEEPDFDYEFEERVQSLAEDGDSAELANMKKTIEEALADSKVPTRGENA